MAGDRWSTGLGLMRSPVRRSPRSSYYKLFCEGKQIRPSACPWISSPLSLSVLTCGGEQTRGQLYCVPPSCRASMGAMARRHSPT
jgi:hypothetical protein